MVLLGMTVWGAHSGSSLVDVVSSSRRWPLHPTLRLDLQEPILCRGNSAQVFVDMLLSYIADRNFVAIAIPDGNTKQSLRQQNSLGVPPEPNIMPTNSG